MRMISDNPSSVNVKYDISLMRTENLVFSKYQVLGSHQGDVILDVTQLGKLQVLHDYWTREQQHESPRRVSMRHHIARTCRHILTDGGDHGYRHILALLKDWHKTLKMATQQAEETKSKRFENYYQVLEVDEDYFPDEELFTIETGDPRITRVERE